MCDSFSQLNRSDVLGQFMPLVGRDWSQTGVAHLLSAIKVCRLDSFSLLPFLGGLFRLTVRMYAANFIVMASKLLLDPGL